MSSSGWPKPGDVGIFRDEVDPKFDWRVGDACVFDRLYRETSPDAGWWTNMRTGNRETWLFSRFRPLPEDQP